MIPAASSAIYEYKLQDPQNSLFGCHLQWFAAEEEGRTEDPTEHKIRKAREDGKVARSPDVSSAVVLLFAVITIGILGDYLLHNLIDMITRFLSLATEVDITKEKRIARVFIHYFIRIVLPIGIVSFIGALAGNLIQVGFLFTTKPIAPDLNRIAPNFPKFFKRAFLSSEAAFNLMKSLVKVFLIGVISFLNIRSKIPVMYAIPRAHYWVGFTTTAALIFRILVEVAILLLVFSIFDYLFQRHQHRESLKMTKQEVKEERRMHEGDPYIQNRLRERMREILQQNMFQNVPQADVVITNPTHYAIATEWKPERMLAPMVIAKGADNMAKRIREIAKENDVPIIENKPLARALYAEVEIGDVVPEKYYEIMAVVLAEVYRMKGKGSEAVS